jgi:hypothetical protein
MTTIDEEYSHENSIRTREEILSDASQMPYLVGTCLLAEEAKDLACRLIDSGLPVMVDRMDGLPEGPCWLVFTDHEQTLEDYNDPYRSAVIAFLCMDRLRVISIENTLYPALLTHPRHVDSITLFFIEIDISYYR